MTAPEPPRRVEDLRRVLSEHEPGLGDLDGLVAGVHRGVARRAVRRRRAGVAAAALATAVLVVAVPTLLGVGPPAVVGTVAGPGSTTSAPTTRVIDEPAAVFAPDRLAFTVEPEPGADPTDDRRGFAAVEDVTAPGSSLRSYVSAGSDPSVLVVHRYDPAVAGVPEPAPTGTVLALAGRDVQVLAADPRGLGTYAVGWQPTGGGWLTIASSAAPDRARDEVLALVDAVETDGSTAMTTPIELTRPASGLSVAGASRAVGPDAVLRTALWLTAGNDELSEALLVYAEYDPGRGIETYPEGYSETSDGAQNVTSYAVDGWYVNLHAAPSLTGVLTRADLEQIAAGLRIDPAAIDVARWRALPG